MPRNSKSQSGLSAPQALAKRHAVAYRSELAFTPLQKHHFYALSLGATEAQWRVCS